MPRNPKSRDFPGIHHFFRLRFGLIASIFRKAGILGFLTPISHDATVGTETPIFAANSFRVSNSDNLIFLISNFLIKFSSKISYMHYTKQIHFFKIFIHRRIFIFAAQIRVRYFF